MDILLDRDRAGRTYDTALAAAHTVGLRHRPVKRRHHLHFRTAVGKIQNPQSLNLIAGSHAVAAENTFIRVADDVVGDFVQRQHRLIIFKPDITHSQLLCQILQRTDAVFLTGRTIPAVGGKQKLQDHLSVVLQARRVRVDHHPIPRNFRAGGEDLSPVVFHHTHAAGAVSG